MTVPKVLAATLLAVAAALNVAPVSTSAGEPSGNVTWAVTPASSDAADGRSWIELDVDPGEVVVEHLAVKNFSDKAVAFRLSAADGYLTDGGRFNMLQTGEQSIAAGTWIDIATAVTVGPGETTIVPFEIRVPPNATPGDAAAGVAASILSSSAVDGGSTVGVESRVGFRVMARVSGEIAPAIAVLDTSGTYELNWNPFAPGAATVTFTIVNRGNTRLFVDASAEAAGRFLPATSFAEAIEMLPGDERTMTAAVPDVWPIGMSAVSIDVSAATEARTEPVVTGRADVLVVAPPVPQLLVIVGVTMVILSVVWGRRRRRSEIERLLEEARDEGARTARAETGVAQ